jgi:hypothetical protein
MDHRWDEDLRAEHRRRIEAARYGSGRVDEEEETEVMRRDRIARSMESRVNRSPWAIGAAHWNQRDLYTRGSDVDDSGYARGPALHPEVGSYAYPRWNVAAQEHETTGPKSVRPSVYEREAWPWLNYERFQRGPKGYHRSDAIIYEDVCEALAYDGFLDATEITAKVEEAEVTLEGTVVDRVHKRVAEQLAERVRGVVDVHNRLEIRRNEEKPKSGDGGDDLTFAAPIVTLTPV